MERLLADRDRMERWRQNGEMEKEWRADWLTERELRDGWQIKKLTESQLADAI